MKRWLGCAAFSLLLVSRAAFGQIQVDPFNPGSAESPPGPGCAIGTSGCFPSAPPGPQWVPEDPGATSTFPPQVVDPQNIPFYGTLPGPAGELKEPIAQPDTSWQYTRRVQALLEAQTEQLQQQATELQAQREQLRTQTEELAAQREQLQNQNEQLAAQTEEVKKLRGEQAPSETPSAPSEASPPASPTER